VHLLHRHAPAEVRRIATCGRSGPSAWHARTACRFPPRSPTAAWEQRLIIARPCSDPCNFLGGEKTRSRRGSPATQTHFVRVFEHRPVISRQQHARSIEPPALFVAPAPGSAMIWRNSAAGWASNSAGRAQLLRDPSACSLPSATFSSDCARGARWAFSRFEPRGCHPYVRMFAFYPSDGLGSR